MAGATPLPGFLSESIVYGPVRSRRLGVSLGVNVVPLRSKLCSFNCPYCECGFNTERAEGTRWPSPDEIAHSVQRVLDRLAQPPEWITFSGNGEPTLHPRFAVAVDRVLAIRDRKAPGSKVGILSNGLAAEGATIRAALLRLDGRFLKLDPGPPELVNGAGYDTAHLAESYRALKPYTLQAMVVKGPGWDGSSEESVAAWLDHVVAADPDQVHLYSLDRAPADSRLEKVPRERLEAMATGLRRALPRVSVVVF